MKQQPHTTRTTDQNTKSTQCTQEIGLHDGVTPTRAARMRRREGTWIIVPAALALALILVLSLGLRSARAQSAAPVAPAAPAAPNALLSSNQWVNNGPVQVAGQSFFDDLDVKAGEALEGDVVVYKGDVNVRAGGRINGGLVAYAGDVRIASGATVTGDIVAWAGDVVIDGRAESNVSAFSGDVRLGSSAYVGGDVSVLAGDIDRREGATVAGNALTGPTAGKSNGLLGLSPQQFSAPAAPNAPVGPQAPDGSEQSNRGRTGPFSWLIGAFVRLLLAAIFAILLTLGAMLAYTLKPQVIDRTVEELGINPTRSFALGITVMGALWLTTYLLARAFCFAPLSIIPGAASFALGAVGFTVAARWMGRRLAGGNAPGQGMISGQPAERRQVLEVAMGGLLIGVVFLAFGALIGGMWGLALLLPVAPGVGAFLNPWFTKYRNRTPQDLSSPGRTASPVPPPAPVAPAAPPAPRTPPAPRFARCAACGAGASGPANA